MHVLRIDSSGNTFLDMGWNGNNQSLTLTGIARNDLTADQFIFDASTTPRNIVGTANSDTLFGGRGDDVLIGGDGTNFIIADAGNDILIGGSGMDILSGGTGTDQMTGGAGNDTYYVHDVTDIVNESVSDGGVDQVLSYVSYDLSGTASGVENAWLAWGNINLIGNDLDNRLTGYTGDNRLDGGNGNDTLRGGAGNDVLIGGAGNDALYGEADNDVFVFSPGSGRDTVFDFSTTEDRLDLRDYGIDTAAELAPYASNVGPHLVVDFGSDNVITIHNLQWAQVTDGLLVV